MQRGNFHKDMPDASREERIELLASFAGRRVRIERIVSEAQATPEGLWYDQAWDEWVLILTGGADLAFEGPEETMRLETGDWVLIPARRRHRVEGTDAGTVWLAVHGDG